MALQAGTAGVEETALAALAFLGAGYTHVSRDVIDGVRFGDVVRRLIQTLIDTPSDDDEAAALRALALCEAYGLTGSNRFRQPAQEAVEDGLRRFERGWSSLDATARWVEALRSAALAGLDVLSDAVARHVASLRPAEEPGESPPEAAAHIRALAAESYGQREAAMNALVALGPSARPALREAAEGADVEVAGRARAVLGTIPLSATTGAAQILAAKLHLGNRSDAHLLAQAVLAMKDEASPTDTKFWYWAATALYLHDGPDGDAWKAAGPAIRDRMLEALSMEGDVGGSVADTARATLALEIYYRYASVFGGRP